MLILPRVPTRVTELVPSLVRVTPATLATLKMPLFAVRVTDSGPNVPLMLPSRATLSGSLMLMPLMARGVPASGVGADGKLMAGRSLTGVIWMSNVPDTTAPPPSDRAKPKLSAVDSSPLCW